MSDAARLDALAEALGLGSRAQPVVDAVSRLYESLDAALGDAAGGLELPCRPGCDACCHESVFVSAPELLVAVQALLARGPIEAERVIAEMQRWAEVYEDELELLEILPAGVERDEVAARVKFRCPMLSPAGACEIYGGRELNARTFGQSWDEGRGAAYGCGLTLARLSVLPPEAGPRLFSAREARRRLAQLFPDAGKVQVYPWWFQRYGALMR
ncbi:MAG: hypothetical protein U1E65_00635 [Myxococcota bacterium]